MSATPGPWRIDSGESWKNSADPPDNYYGIEAGGGFYDRETETGFHVSGFCSIRDARLIAAAPELLAALRGCLESMQFIDVTYKIADLHAMKKAYAAIAKATGAAA